MENEDDIAVKKLGGPGPDPDAVPKEIGSVNPIGDFKKMTTDRN